MQTQKFLRADLVYISYYALEARLSDREETLAEVLMEKDVFSRRDWMDAQDLVIGNRL